MLQNEFSKQGYIALNVPIPGVQIFFFAGYILAIVSKIFERIVYDQVESYLDQKKKKKKKNTFILLYKFQTGFRSRYCTDICSIQITDYIKFQMDKGHFVGTILLDLEKAFDTVAHIHNSILLMKL